MATDYNLDQIAAVGSVADADQLYIVTAGGLDGRATAAQMRATTAAKISDFSSAADARISAQKGAVNGVCGLDSNSKVANSNLTTTGASSVVLRDANQNITVNRVFEAFTAVAASATQLTLTIPSAPNYIVTGSGGQVIQLPNATTLPNGATYLFNNNQSSGAISVNNNSGSLIATVPTGGFTAVSLIDNSIAAGSWERHEQAPSNVTWSTNTLDYAGSITSATWNGNAVAVNRGGTGAATLTGLVKGNGTAAMTAAVAGTDYVLPTGNITGTAAGLSATLVVANGGTGATTASGARTALSAASSGANTDISSVALTTGTVSTSPSASTDIVNKAYVDAIASNVNFHNSCNYATIAALSPSATYSQPGGASVGVGAILTGTAPTALQVDGATVSVGQRILVKNQANTFQNGIYTVTRQGDGSTVPYILTRATDYDTAGGGVNEVQVGDFVLVTSGTLVNTAWIQQTPGTIVFGTSAISFIQFSQAAAIAGVSSFSGGSTGLTPNTASTGAVSLAGTLAITNGGTGAATGAEALANLGNTIFPVSARQSGNLAPASQTATTMTYAAGAGIGGTAVVDGYTLVQGDVVLLIGQSTGHQNGPWVVTTLGTASVAAVLTRPSWFTTGTAKSGTLCLVQYGSVNTGTIITLSGPLNATGAAIVIGTSAITIGLIWGKTSLATTAGNVFSGPQTLRANGSGAQNCPLIFQAGVALMTTPIGNAVEWFGDTMYLTSAAGVRDNVLTEKSFGTY